MKKLLLIALLIGNLLPNDIVNNPFLASRIRLFEEWINTQMDYLSINGVSVGIIHNQELVYSKGFGYANEEKQIIADENTNYRIASITKLFTSIALMKLVEEGTIKLNDPVTKYIPELNNIQTNGNDVDKITITSIMRHTTGLPRNVHYMWDAKNVGEQISTNEALILLSKQSLVYKPNRIYKYSNLAMTIAGKIIERASEMKYEEYINENIFLPLEMLNSHTIDTIGENNNLAVGYGKLIDGKRNPHEWVKQSNAWGNSAGGITSNIGDLSKFIKWHFLKLNDRNNSIISYNSLRKMQKVHWMGIGLKIHPIFMSPITFLSNIFNIGGGFGLGYLNDFNFVGHNGQTFGFSSELLMDNKNKIGIIVLSNSHDAPVYSFDDRSISKNLYEIVGKGLIKPNEDRHLIWAEYENAYSDNFFYNIYVTELNGELAIVDLDSPSPLKKPSRFNHLDGDAFNKKCDYGWNQGESDIMFERDDNNKIISLIGVNYRMYPKY